MSNLFNFTKRSRNVIKQERLDENRSCCLFTLPEPNPNFNLTFKQFKRLEVAEKSTKAPESFEIRKIILHLLKDRPDLWKNMRRIDNDEWRELGLDLFMRTGEVVSVAQLIDTFRKSKTNLNQRMSKCFKDGLGVVDSETVLSHWDFFPHIRFYYEYKLENRHFDDEDDDEIDYVGSYKQIDNQIDVPVNIDYDQDVPVDNFNRSYQSSLISTDLKQDNYITPSENVSQYGDFEEPKSRKRHLDFSTEKDVEQISYQLQRVFNQYPEKESIIRKAMFATILELDERNFQDLGEMFTSLAAKYSTPERKLQI